MNLLLARPSPHRQHPHALWNMSPAAAGTLRWFGRALGGLTLVALCALILPEGTASAPGDAVWEQPLSLVLLGFVALAYAVAWWREGTGAGLLLVAGACFFGFGAIAHEPLTGDLAAAALIASGFLLALHWQWHVGPLRLGAMAAAVLVVVYGGWFASAQVWDYFYGPTHPTSDTQLAPVDLVRWAWSGGVTGEEFVVVADLAEPAAAPELVVSTSPSLQPATRFPGERIEAGERNLYRFRAAGLDPGVEYHYAVAAGEHLDQGRRGSLTTFPEGPASFTFAAGADMTAGSNGQVFDRIREADPLFMLLPGDFHYEDLYTKDPGEFLDAYAENLEQPAQEALFLETPLVYSWDDHDYGGNDSDATAYSRDAAREAYANYVPHYPLPSPDGAIYQSFSVGRVFFIVTDSRSERLPAGKTDGEPTMLGAAQLAWLKDRLLEGRDGYALTVWVNGDPWISSPNAGKDDWGGFAAEREEIANFIAANGIDRLAMISGDAHMVAIDDGTNSNYATVGDASFPVLQAAALDRRGSKKGGPYSEGAIAGGGQFALVTVEDDGETVRMIWSCRNWKGEEMLHYEFER